MLKKLAITFALITAFTSLTAASPAELTVFPEQSSTEINSFTSYEVTVENVGPVKDVYTLSSQATQVSLAPRQVTLEPGTSETVNLWYNPEQNQDEGTFSFSVDARSRATGKVFSAEASVNVIKDHQVDVAVEPEAQTSCLNQQATYTVDVTNNGIQDEEFELTTRQGTLSQNTITLEAGETREVTLSLSSAQPVEGNFNVIAASTTSYAQDIENVQFSAEDCYESEVSITPQNQEVAAFNTADYEVTVRNTGTKADTFTLSTSTGELSSNEVEVEGKSTETVTLSVRPETLGTSSVTVTASGQSEASATVRTVANNGMDMNLELEEPERIACETGTTTYELEISNTGEADETYTVSTNTGSLEEQEVQIDEGDSEEVELTLDSENYETGSTVRPQITVTGSTFNGPSKTVTGSLNVQNCWDLDMNVVPKVASAGENQSVIYEIYLENTGTRENTYEVAYEGPSWIDIRPSEVTVEAGETGKSYMYAGIPFEKKGEATINVTGVGEQIRKSQEVRLLIGKDVEDAIKSGEGGGITGAFSNALGSIGSSIAGSGTLAKLLLSVIIGAAIVCIVLFREWY